jgi:hypothetical protein
MKKFVVIIKKFKVHIMATSTAQLVGFSFAESSKPNESVHFSFHGDHRENFINLRIPVHQLTKVIDNLESIRKTMEDDDIYTGRDKPKIKDN